MSSNNSIISRTHRLNKLIVCCSDEVNSGITSNILLHRETLLDAFDVLYNECNKDALKKSDRNILEFTKKYQYSISEAKKHRVNINDFNIKTLIGKGFFGEVHLAVENVTRDVYAIKRIPKTSFTQSKEERNIMAMSHSDWIPKLQYAFQDHTHLYLVMEYLPGGDLFSLMIRNNRFSEDVIQFYLAEITLALNALHTIGFVHRDVKPENILFDRLGHLKLADFGSAISIEKDGNIISYTPAGTPDYIAPELLQPIHSKRPMKTIYNETCDFWSMGIIAYEMLTETTPFHSPNVHDTYNQILTYVDGTNVDKLEYPHDTEVSDNLRDLIDHLVTKVNNRLNYRKIITHKFFHSIEWMNLRQQIPPIIPILNGEDDTSNFEEDIKKSRRNNTFDTTPASSIKNSSFSGFDLPFIGFGYVARSKSK